MANRQALRELQSRLASRLQAARDEGPSLVWLAAEAGGARLLFPLSQAGEIFPWSPVQPVPYAAPWFMGVANLRGTLAGVVDLGRFTAAAAHADGADGAAPSRPADALPADASLLSLNPLLGVPCALMIERLLGLRGGDAFVAAQPRADDAPAWHGAVYTDAQQQRWQEIDLQALAAHPPFLSIAA